MSDDPYRDRNYDRGRGRAPKRELSPGNDQNSDNRRARQVK